MKAIKIVLIILGVLVVLVIALFGLYLLINRQGVVEAYDIGDSETSRKLLIASQGSDFKNALVESLTTHLAKESIYMHVIDVTDLENVKEDDWDAFLLIHTTEQWKLQPDVKAFLDRAKYLDKVVVVTTSGSGEWKSEEYDVDVMTSASKSEELPVLTNDIVSKLQEIIQSTPAD